MSGLIFEVFTAVVQVFDVIHSHYDSDIVDSMSEAENAKLMGHLSLTVASLIILKKERK